MRSESNASSAVRRSGLSRLGKPERDLRNHGIVFGIAKTSRAIPTKAMTNRVAGSIRLLLLSTSPTRARLGALL
jgi:hypothetical protein